MPYIHENLRRYYKTPLNEVISSLTSETTSGDMNYVITTLLHKFIELKGSNYEAYNSAVGLLECAKLELYRRKVAVYEDLKKAANGDV